MYELGICDLGGVLFDIDFDQTIIALESLDGYNGKKILFEVDFQLPLFIEYDKGTISTEKFVGKLRKMFGYTVPDSEIEEAWCAILKMPFRNALTSIEHLRSKCSKLVLLSNISELHLKHAEPLCAELFSKFDALYFSCKIHLRKPDVQALIYVCNDQGVDPSKTILVDDSDANCNAAQTLGMATYKVASPALIKYQV